MIFSDFHSLTPCFPEHRGYFQYIKMNRNYYKIVGAYNIHPVLRYEEQ